MFKIMRYITLLHKYNTLKIVYGALKDEYNQKLIYIESRKNISIIKDEVFRDEVKKFTKALAKKDLEIEKLKNKIKEYEEKATKEQQTSNKKEG